MPVRRYRDDFSEKTKTQLAKRCGMRCSNPNCVAPTVGPGDGPSATMNIGVAAHICAASPGGKRFDAGMTPAQRAAIENGIWLCQNCAKLIDSDEDFFPIEKLQAWRVAAENRARDELRATSTGALGSEAGVEGQAWEVVSFTDQRSIRFAMSGHGLAEHDVQACPMLDESQHVIDELRECRIAHIAGESGSGKSIVAYHAAHHFSELGWRVVRPIDAASISAAVLDRLANVPDKTLLVVDNAQTLSSGSLAALSATPRDHLAVLTITTINDALPRHTIVIEAKRAVATLARVAAERAKEWGPILKELDPQIGEETLDIPYESRVGDAADAEAAWHFFFVARGGWQSAKRQVSSLRARDRADLVAVAVATGQILHLDGSIPQDWFDRSLPLLGRPAEWLTHAQREGVEAGAILDKSGLRCPHIAYAANVLRVTFDDIKAARDSGLIVFLRAVLEAGEVPLRGVSWLMRELRLTNTFRVHAHDVVTENGWLAFRDRALSAMSSEERRDAAYGIIAVASWRPKEDRVLKPLLGTFADWISASNAITASALADVVNSLINDDRELAEELCRLVSVSAIAGRIAEAPISDWYVWGKLLGRLAIVACDEWKKEFASELPCLKLPDRVKACDADTLTDAAELAHAVYCFDHEMALDMIRKATPQIADAIVGSPGQAWRKADGVFWWCLGFPPEFLRNAKPTDQQRAAALHIIESLDLPALALGINQSPYREWEAVAEFMFFIYEVSPASSEKLIPMLSIDALDRVAGNRWVRPTRSLLLMLVGLSTGGAEEPIRSWLERHTDELGEVSDVLVLLYPQWATDRLAAGVPFNPDALGGLHWSQVAHSIATVRSLSPSEADAMVEACERKLASALTRLAPIDDDELPAMLAEMAEFHPRRLRTVIEKVDMTVARKEWLRQGSSKKGSHNALVEQLHAILPVDHALRDVAEAVLVSMKRC